MFTFLSQLFYLFAVRCKSCQNGPTYESLDRRHGIFKLAWRYAKVQRWYDAQHEKEMSWKRRVA